MRQNPFAQPFFRPFLLLSLFCLAIAGQAMAGAPAGYYDSADETNAATLRVTVHNIIKDHTKIPYTAASTDTWNVLELADQDPNDSSRILDVYLNASYQKWGAGNNDYNREHTWPKSFGFPNDGDSNYPYSDCHQLFLCNDSRNTSRSNKPYGTVGGSGTTEYTTEVNNGVGGGSGTYPGWSNWANTTYWETWWDRRGDVARAQFYMDVRYEGGTHGITGYAEPDLILTDNVILIENSNTGSNESVAYMGLLSTLLQWNQDDPVDAKEMARNDAIFPWQGNRNPFIDHPEWVDCIFVGNCTGGSDTTPPAAPTGLVALAGDGSIFLDWADNAEADLAGYTVYRSTAIGGPYSSASGGLVGISQFTDNGLTNGTTYYYVVSASDLSANESAVSSEASATPEVGAGGGGSVVWINEFHYDNDGTDTGEFFEVAGPAGFDLSGWSLIGYNGNGGVVYDTVNLSGVLPNQQNGYGTMSFNMVGMQNGSPDGLALVDGSGAVVEFISYEGVVNATDGPAAGTSSTDIGVVESAATPIGFSLQLGGTGSSSGDFTWQPEQAHTAGAVNTGQVFSAPVNQAPTAVANGPYTGESGLSISFSASGSTDPDGTIVAWAWDFGDGGSSTLADPTHTYAAAGNYTVTLTVTDDLSATDTDSTSAAIVNPSAAGLPSALPVAQIARIYPNPFNPATNIRFVVGEPGRVRVEIFSVKGALVRTLLNEDRGVGEFELRWNGVGDDGQLVPSGAYFCRVSNGGFSDTRSLLLLK